MSKRELKNLLSRVDDLGLSVNFRSKIINDALAGETRSALNSQIDQSALRGDISSQGQGHQGGGTGKTTKTNTNEQRITSFDQVKDDNDFFQAFSTGL